jgi:hypothetical protein
MALVTAFERKDLERNKAHDPNRCAMPRNGDGWCAPHRTAGSTTSPTIRRTSGNTRNSVGSAMIHDTSHAVGQAEKNSALGPKFLTVATAETIIDITIESTAGITIPA